MMNRVRGAGAALALVAGAALWATPSLSQDATWLTNPGSNDYNTAANWTGGTIPTGTAFFGTSSETSLSLTLGVELNEWRFNAGADDYQFTKIGTSFLVFHGAGIVIDGGSATLNIDDSFLIFDNSSSAGSATINNLAGSSMFMLNSSAAGSANITNDNNLFFSNSSSAGSANLTNNANLRFDTNSTGGQAHFLTNAAGTTDFSDSTGPLGDGRLTAGSLAGAGSYFLGANELTVGGNDLSSEVTGVISDCGPTGFNCQAPGATGGSLVKDGAGTFTLSGLNTYTGPTTVNGGTLAVNGSIVSDVTVTNGGRLGGTGQLAAVTVGNGGIYAPGNSIGTQTVNGAFRLGAGATYEVEVDAAGLGDRVVVNGTVNITGATLRVLAANGDYAPSTDYLIIDNDGADAVVGTFNDIISNLAFLTPTVVYDGGTGNDVVLTLMRTMGGGGGNGGGGSSGNGFLSFCSVAETANQCNVAHALDLFPTSNELFLAVLTQTVEGARQAFDALSGEIHATVGGVLADDSRYVRDTIMGRLMQAGHTGNSLGAAGPQMASLDQNGLDQSAMALGYDDAATPTAPVAFWTAAYGAWGDYDGNRNTATADRDLGGFVSGMDASLGGSWRVGLAAGAAYSSIDVNGRNSSADVDSFNLAGYAGGMAGAFALRGGGNWAWSEIDTSRAVVFPGFFERQTASYDADTGQIFGEVAYPTSMGGMSVEPFAGLAYVSVDTDSFVERGGALASLRGRDTGQNVGYSTLGFRAATTTTWGSTEVTPHLSAAWQHAFNDVTPDAALAFATTGIGFNVTGVPLAKNSALIDAGLDFALGANLNAGVSYSGQFGDGVQDNAVKGRFTWLF